MLSVISLAACNKPGSTEATGEKMEEAAPAMKTIIDEATPAEDNMGEQGENVGNVAKEAIPTPEEFVIDVDITAKVKAAILC